MERPTATSLAQQYGAHIMGKTIMITGVSPGSIAAQLAIALAQHKPNLLLLGGRSSSKLEETATQVAQAAPTCKTRNLVVDFASLNSVRQASTEVNSYAESIDIVILSAGIMAPPYRKTEDGFESSFGVNHVGPFLFVNSIIKKIQLAAQNSSDGARIVIVSSDGHAVAGIGQDLDDIGFHDGQTYNQWRAYGQSKTANTLFALSLSDKMSSKYNIQSYSLHPGVILSTSLGTDKSDSDWAEFFKARDDFAAGLSDKRRSRSTNDHTRWEHPDFNQVQKTVDEGAATLMAAGFDPSIKSQTGGYLQDCKVDNEACEEHAKSRSEAERLWTISEQCVGQKFDY